MVQFDGSIVDVVKMVKTNVGFSIVLTCVRISASGVIFFFIHILDDHRESVESRKNRDAERMG